MEKHMPEPTPFGKKLFKWRSERRMKQTQLEKEVQCAGGYISKLERGNIRTPPDRTTCTRIALALGMDADQVWEAAVEERLRELDSDIYGWMLDRMKSTADHSPNQAEVGLVEDLRALDATVQGPEPWVEVFDDLVMLLGALADAHDAGLEGDRKLKIPGYSPRSFLDALSTLNDMPADLAAQALSAAATVISSTASAYGRGQAERRGGRP
jgi:transcriptional regulator with XRE-family HTH domain